MIDDKPSQTAIMALVSRALDARLAPERRICQDEFARYFLTNRSTLLGETWIPEPLVRFYHRARYPGVSAYVMVRTRFFDDVALQAARNGAMQIVDLGAGYDTRFYRYKNEFAGVCLFEVDFPATQRRKRELLQRVPGFPFENVRFVPVDFMKESLPEKLAGAGFDPTAKTLFLWEGVSYYVDAVVVDAVLKFVRDGSGPGSSLVFDTVPPFIVEYTRRHKPSINAAEPLLWGIEPETIPAFLRERGFDCAEHHLASELGEKYCVGKVKRRYVAPWYSLILAAVR